jgi:predicted dehydrogenase
MGQAWAKNLDKNPNVALAGWVDLREGAAAEAAEKNSLTFEHCGTDLERAIAQSRPDFVVDVTIPEAHHGVTLTALSHGLPVIGEKPMAHSMEAAREMVAASDKAGKLYMVSQSRRYNPALRAYRRLIEKTAGRLEILNADFYIGAHFGGFRDEMDHVLLLDMAIHSFDEARYLLDDAKPVSVYAEEFNPSWSWYRGAACATCLFELENGVRFTYRGSWCSEGLHTSWECEWRGVGAGGTALWDGHGKLQGAKVTGSEGFHHETVTTDEPIVSEEVAGGIEGSLGDFLNALDTGSTPHGECHDNIHSLAMVFAAIESATTGRRVAITL